MTVRVGIIGCGAIAINRHAPEYAGNRNCIIEGFCDPIIDRARELSSKFGGEATIEYMDILQNPRVDAVSICTSNDTHASIAIEALKAGKHVLCEKPMAINTEEAKEMIRIAKESGKYLMIGHNQRLILAHRRVKEILMRGEMGKVLTFKTAFKHGGPESWSADKGNNTWFFRKQSSYFGVLGDLGIHKVDLIQWLLGEDISEVSAKVATLNKKDNRNEVIEVEDNALCSFKTTGGIIGTMEVSWTNYGVEDNSTVLYCENGVLRICNHPEFDVVVEMNSGEGIYYKTGGVSTNTKQFNSGVIDTFIECIENNKAPDISGEQGYKALVVIEACLKSSEDGKWAQVDHNFELI